MKMTLDELIDRAEIAGPVAANKAAVYSRDTLVAIATTNSEVFGLPENQERDEARAKLIKVAVNNLRPLITSLGKCLNALESEFPESLWAEEYPYIIEAQELLQKLKEEV